jgi:hypothetical protein
MKIVCHFNVSRKYDKLLKCKYSFLVSHKSMINSVVVALESDQTLLRTRSQPSLL